MQESRKTKQHTGVNKAIYDSSSRNPDYNKYPHQLVLTRPIMVQKSWHDTETSEDLADRNTNGEETLVILGAYL